MLCRQLCIRKWNGRHMKENKIKLIALDMDGTLLNEHGVLSRGNREALERSMEKGVHVVIATGRVYSALPQDVTGVSGIEYAITSNGANILRLADEQTVYSNLIGQAAVETLLPLIHDEEIMIEAFFDHQVYAQKSFLANLDCFSTLSEKSKKYTRSTRKPVEDIMELVRREAARMENINLIFRDAEKRMDCWEKLKTLRNVTVTSSMPHNLEIGGETTSKADALAHLCGLLGIRREEVMACGDSENDLAMVQYAGLSVAMENAVPALKEKADYVTKRNDRDGVRHVIEKFVL